MLKLILGKIPPYLQKELWAQQLAVDLRLKAKEGKAPWTARALIAYIASFLAKSPVPVVRVARNDRAPAKPTDGKEYTGSVGMWNTDKSYGFIKPDGSGDDAFVHKSDIIGGGALAEGERVTFQLARAVSGANAGKIKAIRVGRIEKAAPPTPPPPPPTAAVAVVTQTEEEEAEARYEYAPTVYINC